MAVTVRRFRAIRFAVRSLPIARRSAFSQFSRVLLDGVRVRNGIAGLGPNMPMTGAHTNRILALGATSYFRQQRVVAREGVIAIGERPRGGVVPSLIFTDDADGHSYVDTLVNGVPGLPVVPGSITRLRNAGIRKTRADGFVFAETVLCSGLNSKRSILRQDWFLLVDWNIYAGGPRASGPDCTR